MTSDYNSDGYASALPPVIRPCASQEFESETSPDGPPRPVHAWGSNSNTPKDRYQEVESDLLPQIAAKGSADSPSSNGFRGRYNQFSNNGGYRERSPDGIRSEAAMRNMKHELVSLRNRALIEISQRDHEILEIRKELSYLKEVIQKQKAAIKERDRSLAEFQRIDGLQQRSLAKAGSQADQQIRTLKNKIKDIQSTHNAAMSHAIESVQNAKRERNTLCSALAMLASQALGGDLSTTEEVQADMEALLIEGGDPVPRHPQLWLGLRYESDERGSLVSFTQGASGRSAAVSTSSPRPYDQDGARAVAALSRQIARLWRQRALYRSRLQEGANHLHQVQGVLDNVDQDFACVNVMIDRLQQEALRLSRRYGLPLFIPPPSELPPNAMSGKLSERFDVVQRLVRGLTEEVLVMREKCRAYKAAQGQGQGSRHPSPGGSPSPDSPLTREDVVRSYQEELCFVYGSEDFIGRQVVEEWLNLEEVAQLRSGNRRRGRSGSPSSGRQQAGGGGSSPPRSAAAQRLYARMGLSSPRQPAAPSKSPSSGSSPRVRAVQQKVWDQQAAQQQQEQQGQDAGASADTASATQGDVAVAVDAAGVKHEEPVMVQKQQDDSLADQQQQQQQQPQEEAEPTRAEPVAADQESGHAVRDAPGTPVRQGPQATGRRPTSGRSDRADTPAAEPSLALAPAAAAAAVAPVAAASNASEQPAAPPAELDSGPVAAAGSDGQADAALYEYVAAHDAQVANEDQGHAEEHLRNKLATQQAEQQDPPPEEQSPEQVLVQAAEQAVHQAPDQEKEQSELEGGYEAEVSHQEGLPHEELPAEEEAGRSGPDPAGAGHAAETEREAQQAAGQEQQQEGDVVLQQLEQLQEEHHEPPSMQHHEMDQEQEGDGVLQQLERLQEKQHDASSMQQHTGNEQQEEEQQDASAIKHQTEGQVQAKEEASRDEVEPAHHEEEQAPEQELAPQPEQAHGEEPDHMEGQQGGAGFQQEPIGHGHEEEAGVALAAPGAEAADQQLYQDVEADHQLGGAHEVVEVQEAEVGEMEVQGEAELHDDELEAAAVLQDQGQEVPAEVSASAPQQAEQEEQNHGGEELASHPTLKQEEQEGQQQQPAVQAAEVVQGEQAQQQGRSSGSGRRTSAASAALNGSQSGAHSPSARQSQQGSAPGSRGSSARQHGSAVAGKQGVLTPEDSMQAPDEEFEVL